MKRRLKLYEQEIANRHESSIRPADQKGGDPIDYLRLSGHDETKLEGGVMVFIDFAVEIGLLQWDKKEDGTSCLEAGENMALKEIFLCGDCLTVSVHSNSNECN